MPMDPSTIRVVITLFLVLATVPTFVRLYERSCVQHILWWDDWTMLLAWVMTAAMCAIQLAMAQNGAGLNIQDVPNDQLEVFSKLFLDLQPVARGAILLARVSILLLYLRLFFPVGVARGLLWWLVHLTIWLNIFYSVALILATALQCVPSGRPWGSSCIDQYLVLIISSVINIVSDLAVLLIPVSSMWRLQMKRRTKWAVLALFVFGALAPLVSAARLAYQIPDGKSKNKTIVYPTIALLATAEQVVAMVGGSVPVAATMFARWFKCEGQSAGQNKHGQTWKTPSHTHPYRRRQFQGGHDGMNGGAEIGTCSLTKLVPNTRKVSQLRSEDNMALVDLENKVPPIYVGRGYWAETEISS